MTKMLGTIGATVDAITAGVAVFLLAHLLIAITIICLALRMFWFRIEQLPLVSILALSHAAKTLRMLSNDGRSGRPTLRLSFGKGLERRRSLVAGGDRAGGQLRCGAAKEGKGVFRQRMPRADSAAILPPARVILVT